MTDGGRDGQAPRWYSRTVNDVFLALGSSSAGLGAADAAARLEADGPNEIVAGRRVSAWRLLLGQFRNVLMLILLGATLLSFLTGHATESVVIAVIVLFAVVLGFIQEYRAERAIQALRELAAPTAPVLRDGRLSSVPARELVRGDVVLLHPGDRVPADARVVESVNLTADEASLTGESSGVEKQEVLLPDVDCAVGDRTNLVHAGTTITYGRGRAVVVATGMQTEFGQVAALLASVEAGRTPLQNTLDRLGTALARVALVVVAGVVVIGALRGQPLLDMVLFGIALAVAVVPEALPAVVTISLAIGIQKMARRHALIRSLPAVETLGSTSVICSDKTGTLTRDEMTVRKLWATGRSFDVSGSGYEPVGSFSSGGVDVLPDQGVERLLAAAVLVNDSDLAGSDAGWQVKGDPTEGALLVAAAKAGLDKRTLDDAAPRVQEIPFTSERKCMTTLHRTETGTVAYSKGAPERLLPGCTHLSTADGVTVLDDATRAELSGIAQAYARDALRVLAVAMKEDADLPGAQEGMTLLGLVGMFDPPRAEAREAIALCERAGIRPVMITGDHPATATTVARELGLLRHGRVVVGSELDDMDDARLSREIRGIDVFARVSPAHKLRVVAALQANGHVVAMTGDGVNDAPALKKADIGIAMGMTGTDVTREASAMTLTDDNFASIVAAVEEGRGVYDNIKKYLMYLLSSNAGEIGLMVGTAVLGLPLPLTAVQILYVNLATDGLPALALAVDPPQPDLMDRPPRSRRSGIFTRPVVALMLAGGGWLTLVNTGLFLWLIRSGRAVEEAMSMVFVCLVLIQLLNAYNFRSDRHSALVRPLANRWLNSAVLWEAGLLLAIVYVPVLQGVFGTYALSASDWMVLLALSLSVVPVLESVKYLVRRGWFAEVDPAEGRVRS